MSSIHLRYIWPLPPDLDPIFARFGHLVVPELNNGQLVRLLRDATLRPFVSYPKVQGLPFRTAEIEAFVQQVLG